MKVLLCGEFDAGEEALWRRALCAAMPEAAWLDRDAARAVPTEVQAAVVANPPPDVYKRQGLQRGVIAAEGGGPGGKL